MDRFEVANTLRETGLLLNVVGENPYKARAYIKGASALESLSESLDKIVEEERLTEIPGIGASLAANISEIYETGTLRVLERLKSDLPAGIIELSQIPGLTLKRIRALYAELQINDVVELEQACLEHRVANVKGFGAKTEAAILEGLRSHKLSVKKMLLLHARETAGQLLQYLQSATENKEIEIVGSVRRWHEVVDEIRLFATTSDVDKLWDALAKYPLVAEVMDQTEDLCRVRLAEGIVVELMVADSFATGLVEHTGSRVHFDNLKEFASQKGFSFSPDGLYKNDRKVKTDTEEQLYKALGLNFIPPEMREGDGEIEQAETDDFEDLIDVSDIKGMTHCHTTYSDGSYSIEEMALAAEKLGMQYLTITDHSPTANYAGGLPEDILKQQWEEIDEVQERVKIRLLKGTESDILADGKLDYSDEILEKFDIVIASVHNRYKLNYEQMTARVLKCMKNPFFKIWGHPLGRLLLRREPIECDVEKILDAIAESRAAIEINGDPHRLDLAPNWVRLARERGIKFIISTDAHSIRDYRSLQFGVHMARRAGVRRKEVLNTYGVSKFASIVRPGS